MKSRLLILAAVFMVLLSSAVYAQNSCGENIEWKIDDGVLTISGSGEMTDYTKENPAPWKNAQAAIGRIDFSGDITKIGSWSFADLTHVKYVYMPNSLKTIGERAFYGCTEIERLTIPDNVTSIENGAFNGCTGIYFIDMPSELRKIGSSAFMNIPKLKVIDVPQNVSEIGDWAFFGNTSAEAVYFDGKPNIQFGKFVFGRNHENMTVYYPKVYETEWKGSAYFADDILKAFNPSERIRVYVNGPEVVFDQQPIIVDDRTLVPVRAIFEAMGAVVGWDEETKTVVSERNGVIIKISIGSYEMEKDNETIQLDVPAQIIGDRTLVPVRAISEAFGAKVAWNDVERWVGISL